MRFRFMLVTSLSVATIAPALAAQNAPNREGFWFSLGVGAGSLGCSNCDSRESGPTATLSLGGTLNRQLLIGLFSNAWTKTEGGATLTASVAAIGLRWYPSATNGFFLVAGIGGGSVDFDLSGYGSTSESGTGALFGLGYDIPITRGASVTMFWNGNAISFSDGDANFGQLGVGFTIH